MKHKLICFIVAGLVLLSGCGRAVETEVSLDIVVESEYHPRRIEGVTEESAIITEPIEVTETASESTNESIPYDPNETYYTVYTQQTEPWDVNSILDISQLVIPGHVYADTRVEINGDEVFCGFDGMLSVDDQTGNLYVRFADWIEGVEKMGYFDLDGVVLPSDLEEMESGTYKPYEFSFMCTLQRIFGDDSSQILVYVVTDGVAEDRGDIYPWYHGFIYFMPVVDRFNYGRAMYPEEVTQLNEWLLAYGFAEPDRAYTGEYSEIYQQYPDFGDRFAGYPLIDPQSADDDFIFTLYNPDAPIEGLDVINYDQYSIVP